jgi:hypothetical protein
VRAVKKWLVVLGACGGSPTTMVDGAGRGDATAGDDAGLVLDPAPRTYRETCDGSGALALDFDHFLDVNDENQDARVYVRAMDAAPLQTLDLAGPLGLAPTDEADLEELARVGARIFAITSHGRRTNGQLDRARYRFAAFDLSGAPPSVALTGAGHTTQLLDHMLVSGNWDTPNAAVIAALEASSDLADNDVNSLAPEIDGTNIEGLASNNAGALLIGFRNPRPANRAIVVRLVNPDATAAGMTARFGDATTLDLGGLGIRSMAWSPAHAAILIIAGSHAGGGPYKLYRWTGAFAAQPTFVADISAPAQAAPEAVVPYPGTRDVQIIFDGGDADVNGSECKDAPVADRVFHSAIVHVD